MKGSLRDLQAYRWAGIDRGIVKHVYIYTFKIMTYKEVNEFLFLSMILHESKLDVFRPAKSGQKRRNSGGCSFLR